jgi:hypothetical protein
MIDFVSDLLGGALLLGAGMIIGQGRVDAELANDVEIDVHVFRMRLFSIIYVVPARRMRDRG